MRQKLSCLMRVIITFITVLFSQLDAAEQSSKVSDGTATGHADVGKSLGIYTLLNGVLIEPSWTPYALIHYENGNFVADTQTGVGYKFLNDAHFNAGVSMSYQYGRHENADSRYHGMGNISTSPAPSAFAEWLAFSGALDIFVEMGESIGKNRSFYETVDTTLGFPLSNSVSAFFDLLVVGGDEHYARTFYGVSSAQSVNSGYAVYEPGAGLTTLMPSIGISVNWLEHWDVVSSIGMVQYVDVASNSPLVDHKKLATGNLWLSYKF